MSNAQIMTFRHNWDARGQKRYTHQMMHNCVIHLAQIYIYRDELIKIFPYHLIGQIELGPVDCINENLGPVCSDHTLIHISTIGSDARWFLKIYIFTVLFMLFIDLQVGPGYPSKRVSQWSSWTVNCLSLGKKGWRLMLWRCFDRQATLHRCPESRSSDSAILHQCGSHRQE